MTPARPLLLGGLLLGLILGCAGLSRREGLELVELESSGVAREAWVHLPAGWGDDPLPLVIVMHGGGRARRDLALRLTPAWRPYFDDDVVFAFPKADYRGGLAEGTDLRHPRTWTQWDDDASLRGTDLVFLRDLVDTIAEKAPIDRRHVYLTGFSSGAAFVWFASCFDPSPYAGFGVVGMPLPPPLAARCEPATKRPMISIHGAEDSWFPTTAGPDPWQETARWLTEDRRCGRWPVEQPWVEGEHGVRAHGRIHDCRTVRSVELWQVDDVGHCWPGAPDCRGVSAASLLIDYWHRSGGLP